MPSTWQGPSRAGSSSVIPSPARPAARKLLPQPAPALLHRLGRICGYCPAAPRAVLTRQRLSAGAGISCRDLMARLGLGPRSVSHCRRACQETGPRVCRRGTATAVPPAPARAVAARHPARRSAWPDVPLYRARDRAPGTVASAAHPMTTRGASSRCQNRTPYRRAAPAVRARRQAHPAGKPPSQPRRR
jgi:hypothetical protein